MNPRAVPGVLVVGALLLGGCATSGLPGRSSDVTGVVAVPAGNGSSPEPALTGASDAYFEGMPLRLADAVVVDADGRTVDAPAEGDEVEVWIGDGCAESYPVQCEIVAVRVVG